MQSANFILKRRIYRPQNISDLRTKTFGMAFEESIRRKHVELEIGCGVGWHPIELAKTFHPEEQVVIAIERTTQKFSSFQRRFESHLDLKPVLTGVQADAFQFIAQHVPSQSLSKLWMLYPNPEIKRPNNRWYRSPGFHHALTALRPHGHFQFATNIGEYALAAEREAPWLGLRLINKLQFSRLQRPGFSPRTHFEKKYFERGDTLFDYTYEKINEAT